jgi:hypothetical protein
MLAEVASANGGWLQTVNMSGVIGSITPVNATQHARD